MRAMGWLLGITMLGSAAQVSADCTMPPFELLWSYPASGERDVPTNAELWVVVPWGWVDATAQLNGQRLDYAPEANGIIHLTSPALQPNRDYTLELSFPSRRPRELGGMDEKVTIPFHTGTTEAQRPVQPEIVGITAAAPTDTRNTLASSCADVLNAQDCFDVGPLVMRTVEARGDKPLAWLVNSYLVPARCDKPQLITGVIAGCAPVRAIGAGGLASAPAEICWPRSELTTLPRETTDAGSSPSPQARAEDGCRVAGGTGAAPWLLLALRRRRRRSA